MHGQQNIKIYESALPLEISLPPTVNISSDNEGLCPIFTHMETQPANETVL